MSQFIADEYQGAFMNHMAHYVLYEIWKLCYCGSQTVFCVPLVWNQDILAFTVSQSTAKQSFDLRTFEQLQSMNNPYHGSNYELV